jgi:MYXO-CTERM domain-containing protein
MTGGGGCCETGSKPTGPALFALGVLAMVLRPRRRRSC